MTVAEAGRKGGQQRAKKLSKERLIEIAKQGYNASPLSTKRAIKPETAQNTPKEGISINLHKHA